MGTFETGPDRSTCGQAFFVWRYVIFLNISIKDLPKELLGMKNFAATFLALSLLAAFSLGCADIRIKPTELKCPNCGATFTVDEGEKEHLRSMGFGAF